MEKTIIVEITDSPVAKKLHPFFIKSTQRMKQMQSNVATHPQWKSTQTPLKTFHCNYSPTEFIPTLQIRKKSILARDTKLNKFTFPEPTPSTLCFPSPIQHLPLPFSLSDLQSHEIYEFLTTHNNSYESESDFQPTKRQKHFSHCLLVHGPNAFLVIQNTIRSLLSHKLLRISLDEIVNITEATQSHECHFYKTVLLIEGIELTFSDSKRWNALNALLNETRVPILLTSGMDVREKWRHVECVELDRLSAEIVGNYFDAVAAEKNLKLFSKKLDGFALRGDVEGGKKYLEWIFLEEFDESKVVVEGWGAMKSVEDASFVDAYFANMNVETEIDNPFPFTFHAIHDIEVEESAEFYANYFGYDFNSCDYSLTFYRNERFMQLNDQYPCLLHKSDMFDYYGYVRLIAQKDLNGKRKSRRLTHLGMEWNKMKELVEKVNDPNVEWWLKRKESAKEMSLKAIITYLQIHLKRHLHLVSMSLKLPHSTLPNPQQPCKKMKVFLEQQATHKAY